MSFYSVDIDSCPGYDQGMMGGVNTSADYATLMGFGHVDAATGRVVVDDSLLQGGIVAVYYLGTLFGAFLGGWVGDRVGRIRTIALGAIWAILGASLQCSAQNHVWMICARTVNGIGTGVLNGKKIHKCTLSSIVFLSNHNLAIVPVWSTETADHTSRGQFIAIEFTLNIFGVAVAYWLEFGLSFIDGGRGAFQWRFPIAVSVKHLFVGWRTDPNINSSKLFPCSCSLASSGSSPNLPAGYARSAATRKQDTFSLVSVVTKAKTRLEPKLSSRISSTSYNWREARQSKTRTGECY